MNSEKIRNFGWDIQRLLNGSDLTRERAYEMFREVLLNEQPDLQQGAFLAALMAKGETPQEIAGAWTAIDELDTIHTKAKFEKTIVENSGTGMDKLKTFNVSTAAAIVASANGVTVAKHGARAITSMWGTVDILESVGIDVECDVATVEKSIQKAGIGLFNGMSPLVHPRALARILSQIRFGSTLNIAASLANPCRPSYGVRGVYSEKLVPIVKEVMKEIGYERAMVVHGFNANRQNGMDELSILGKTIISELFPDGREERYTIVPEDIGLRRAKYEDIAQTGDIQMEAERFLQVLGGVGPEACIDFTCMNAAAIFYLAGKTDGLIPAVEKSRETILSGKALRKLAEWVSVQRSDSGKGEARFEKILASAKLKLK